MCVCVCVCARARARVCVCVFIAQPCKKTGQYGRNNDIHAPRTRRKTAPQVRLRQGNSPTSPNATKKLTCNYIHTRLQQGKLSCTHPTATKKLVCLLSLCGLTKYCRSRLGSVEWHLKHSSRSHYVGHKRHRGCIPSTETTCFRFLSERALWTSASLKATVQVL